MKFHNSALSFLDTQDDRHNSAQLTDLANIQAFWLYRWVLLKPHFLGAWKSVQLKHYPAYPIIVISLIMQRNLATKIWAKWESGLTAVWLKQDPPVLYTVQRHDNKVRWKLIHLQLL